MVRQGAQRVRFAPTARGKTHAYNGQVFIKPQPARSPSDVFLLACSVALLGSLVAGITASLHWPLVGDASLMHYIVFLRGQGLIPYRDIVDINLPGTYAFEALAIRCFGPNAFGWRLYDCGLLILLGLANITIAGRRNWFAGLFSGSLFALVHLQDGLEQGGQRNLLMAVLLLWSYAALFHGARSHAGKRWVLLAGLGLGCSVTIKPTVLPLAPVLVCGASWLAGRKKSGALGVFVAGTVGLMLPSAAALIWLKQAQALPAFLAMCGNLLALHASLGRQKFSFLLSHCLSPIAVLAGLWLLLCLVERPRLSAERAALLLGVLGGVFAYVAEGKGFPYQRYPLLAILLCLIGMDVVEVLCRRGASRRIAVCLCGLGSFALAPRYAWMVHSFNPATPFESTLSAELQRLGGASVLNGEVQCLDTFGGCINTLYDLRLKQSTGFLYDCYLFSGDSAANRRYRQAFWRAFQDSKPRVVVVTNDFCFADPRGFGKLALWPEFDAMLAGHYAMSTAWESTVLQHWWNRKERPTEFRIYLRKEPETDEGVGTLSRREPNR